MPANRERTFKNYRRIRIHSPLVLCAGICLLSILYTGIIFGQSAEMPNQTVNPLRNSESEHNPTQNQSLLLAPTTSNDNNQSDQNAGVRNITVKLEGITKAINKSSLSELNASGFNTQRLQKLDENLDSELSRIKKSIDNSTLYSNIGLVAGLLSIGLSFGIPYAYDKLKKPDLVIEPGTFSEGSDRTSYYGYLHGKVVNRPHKYWHWIERNAALQTIVKMDFLDKNGQRLENVRNQPLFAKWVFAPEPLVPKEKESDLMFDRSKLAFLYTQTVNSDYEGQSFDILVQIYHKEHYALTGDTYAGYSYQGLRNPFYRIDETEFLVRAQAVSGNYKSKTRTFTIKTRLGKFKRDIEIS